VKAEGESVVAKKIIPTPEKNLGRSHGKGGTWMDYKKKKKTKD